MKPTRSITIRRRARAVLVKAGAPCAECGQPIDYKQPAYVDGVWNPEAFEADHKVPLARGGADTLSNFVAVHARCNRAKGHRAYAPKVIRNSGVLG